MTHLFSCVFSPLSPHLVQKDPYRVLALQFFLKALLASHTAVQRQEEIVLVASAPQAHFPYEWRRRPGHLNQAAEHAMLLRHAFPQHKKSVQAMLRQLHLLVQELWTETDLTSQKSVQLSKKFARLFLLAEPLISASKQNERLLFFLLQHQTAIGELMGSHYLNQFLLSCHHMGLSGLQKHLRDFYHRKGFNCVVPELQTTEKDV